MESTKSMKQQGVGNRAVEVAQEPNLNAGPVPGSGLEVRNADAPAAVEDASVPAVAEDASIRLVAEGASVPLPVDGDQDDVQKRLQNKNNFFKDGSSEICKS